MSYSYVQEMAKTVTTRPVVQQVGNIFQTVEIGSSIDGLTNYVLGCALCVKF